MDVTDGGEWRLRAIDGLMRAQDHEALEGVVANGIERGLLGEETLELARALNLGAMVILLASLGIENLDEAGSRPFWLEVYRSLGTRTETAGFQALAPRLPVKWVVRNILSDRADRQVALRRIKGRPETWLAAFELALDCRRFDLVEMITEYRLEQKASQQEWELITRTLIDRYPLLLRERGVAPLARSVLKIRKRVSVAGHMGGVASSLAIHAAKYFMQCERYGDALAAVKLATASGHRLARMFITAQAACFDGKLSGAIEGLDALLDEALRDEHQERFRREQEEARQRGKAAESFDAGHAAVALAELQAVLDSSGHKVFLVSGTLLGYAREGRLLGHDKDIDVGVINWQSQFDIVLALLGSGRFIVDTKMLGEQATYHIPIRHFATGIAIDIFVYHEESGKFVTGVHSTFGYLQKFAFTPFGLEQVDFLGIKVYVPDDVDRNLQENFGEWRVPDPDYLSHLQSPSTVDRGGLVYQIVARLHCLAAIREGRPERLSRALAVLEQYRENEGGISLERIERVRARFSMATPAAASTQIRKEEVSVAV